MACSAAVLCSLPRGTVTPKRWHGDSEVTALSLDADQALRVAAIPVALEQSPVLPGDGLESHGVAAPALCQPPPSPHVGLRPPQVGPLCLLPFCGGKGAAPAASSAPRLLVARRLCL